MADPNDPTGSKPKDLKSLLNEEIEKRAKAKAQEADKLTRLREAREKAESEEKQKSETESKDKAEAGAKAEVQQKPAEEEKNSEAKGTPFAQEIAKKAAEIEAKQAEAAKQAEQTAQQIAKQQNEALSVTQSTTPTPEVQQDPTLQQQKAASPASSESLTVEQQTAQLQARELAKNMGGEGKALTFSGLDVGITKRLEGVKSAHNIKQMSFTKFMQYQQGLFEKYSKLQDRLQQQNLEAAQAIINDREAFFSKFLADHPEDLTGKSEQVKQFDLYNKAQLYHGWGVKESEPNKKWEYQRDGETRLTMTRDEKSNKLSITCSHNPPTDNDLMMLIEVSKHAARRSGDKTFPITGGTSCPDKALKLYQGALVAGLKPELSPETEKAIMESDYGPVLRKLRRLESKENIKALRNFTMNESDFVKQKEKMLAEQAPGKAVTQATEQAPTRAAAEATKQTPNNNETEKTAEVQPTRVNKPR